MCSKKQQKHSDCLRHQQNHHLKDQQNHQATSSEKMPGEADIVVGEVRVVVEGVGTEVLQDRVVQVEAVTDNNMGQGTA